MPKLAGSAPSTLPNTATEESVGADALAHNHKNRGTNYLGSKMYAMYPADPQKQWIEVANLAQFGIYNIKRLSVSREGDKIAIVDDRARR